MSTVLTPTFPAAAKRPPHFDDVGWAARQRLAACNRVVALLGWTELTYNPIALRLPSAPEAPTHFLINPFGLHYSEVCASNLVRIDRAGPTSSSTSSRCSRG